MNLKNYVSLRFGNREKTLDALVYMLRASLFAPSFRKFWQRWNPLWSYYTLFYVYRPLSRVLPRRLAGLLTFGVSGFFHDCVAMILTANFSIMMTTMFLSWGLIVWAEDLFLAQILSLPLHFRPVYQLSNLFAGVLPALYLFW